MAQPLKKVKNRIARALSDEDTKLILSKINDLEAKNRELFEQIFRLNVQLDKLNRSVATRLDYLSPEYQRFHPQQTEGKKILLCGYYGAQNCGDELMLQACLQLLEAASTNKKPNITILLYNNYDFDPSSYEYPTIHYPKNPADFAFLADTFDAIVWGGGAVIDDNYNYFNGDATNLTYVLIQTSKLMLQQNKEVFIAGVSTNSQIKDPQTISDLNTIFSRAKFVTLRDENSLKTLRDAGVDCENISLVDDLALALDYNPKGRTRSGRVFHLGFTLMPFENNLQEIEDIITKSIRVVNQQLKVNNQKLKIHFISFYNENNNDCRLYQKIAKNLGLSSPDYVIEDLHFDPDHVATSLGQLDLLITMRYHAALIASVLGVRTLCLNYGKNHAHYQNKVSYIQQHYFPELILSDYPRIHLDEIRAALESKPKPWPSSTITALKERLSKEFSAIIK